MFYNKKWYDITTQKKSAALKKIKWKSDAAVSAATSRQTIYRWTLPMTRDIARHSISGSLAVRGYGRQYSSLKAAGGRASCTVPGPWWKAYRLSTLIVHASASEPRRCRAFIWHDINILSSPRPHCTPGARFTKHPTKGARLLLGTINLQSCKIVWDSVRKLAYNISKRIFSIF